MNRWALVWPKAANIRLCENIVVDDKLQTKSSIARDLLASGRARMEFSLTNSLYVKSDKMVLMRKASRGWSERVCDRWENRTKVKE